MPADTNPRCQRWTPEEDIIIHRLYPSATGAEILAALPRRSMPSVQGRAKQLRVRRQTGLPGLVPGKDYTSGRRCKCGQPMSKNARRCLPCSMAPGSGRVCGLGLVAPTGRPRRPTRQLPGSYEKVRVLAKRLARGESLWHEEDAKPCLE